MTIWPDNQLPPALAAWMRATLTLECTPVRDLKRQRVWVTCGNTSNARLRRLVAVAWPAILPMLERGEALVELGDQFDQQA